MRKVLAGKNDMFQIRLAQNADAQGILEAHDSAVHDDEVETTDSGAEYTCIPPSSERIESYLVNSQHETTLVVVDPFSDKSVAGFGSIIEQEDEICALYISSKYFGRGLGTLLLTELEALAKERGCKRLYMDTSLANKGFYTKCGYSVFETQLHKIRNGTVTYFKMQKSL